MNETSETSPLAPEDFYYEDGCMVFTAAYHLKRGSCCGKACRHCPYDHENVRPGRTGGSASREDQADKIIGL